MGWSRVGRGALGCALGVGAVGATGLAMASAVLFDAPGSERSPLTVLLGGALVALPVGLGASAIACLSRPGPRALVPAGAAVGGVAVATALLLVVARGQLVHGPGRDPRPPPSAGRHAGPPGSG